MTSICVNLASPVDSQPFEVVERKGIGHPDTIADGIAEAISVEYSLFCLESFGAVLHHHFDKTVIMGGRAKIDFGIGRMEKPIRLVVNGRVSSRFGDMTIDYGTLQESIVNEHLGRVLPALDVENWLEIRSHTTSYSRYPVWYHPRDLGDLPELREPYANDSAAIVGYWPLSTTERLVLRMEKSFYNSENLPRFDYIGQDIKILAVRDKKDIELTLCVPFMSARTPNRAFYFEKLTEMKSKLLELAREFVGDKYRIGISLNTSDRPLLQASQIGISHYLVASGSALDYGEEGVVGRGNRTRGLISSLRPCSTDAICGKNPAFHVGKVYAYLAENITKRAFDELGCECTVVLVTQNKRHMASPQKVIVNVTREVGEREITRIVEEELHRPDWIERIVKGKYFLPVPGGTCGYHET